jgi:heme-degrading monooxygenase HmoA
MYSRVTLLEIDPVRTDVESAVAIFREQVAPGLREREGYEGAFVFATPEGKGMVISLWDTKEAADAASDFATAHLDRLVTLFAAPPGREHYEVMYADLPGVPA